MLLNYTRTPFPFLFWIACSRWVQAQLLVEFRKQSAPELVSDVSSNCIKLSEANGILMISEEVVLFISNLDRASTIL